MTNGYPLKKFAYESMGLGSNGYVDQMRGKMTFIPYGRQDIRPEDIAAVTRVLQSDFLTTGPEIEKFERAIASYVGAEYCVVVANGTAALHLAVLALELDKGSMGITSPNTFVATSNALVYAGLTPDFVDIDPNHYVIDPDRLKSRLEESKPSVVLPVHFAGNTYGIERISELCRKDGIKVIEDASHSMGGSYSDGSLVGSCSYSDMTTFSFHPVKTMTCGEGGAVTTNNPELYSRLLTLRTHGITRDTENLSVNPGPWYYEMQELGFNYRMTDFQAALGRSQLSRLNEYVNRRAQIVNRYNEAFSGIPWLKTPQFDIARSNSWHLYIILIDWDKIGVDRPQFMAKLLEAGIGSQVLYIPVPDQPYYRHTYSSDVFEIPNAREYYEHSLAIPLYPAMSDIDQERVVDAVVQFK
jgi:UDP-4-amino-4,6-dideoxy-N-acetyl-beta-L-altrosamine transaminase